MAEIGAYICNYNKRDFVINCVDSLLRQNFSDLDVYVIDNASEDDSVETLKNKFGDRIFIICNRENLGGSGGFNVGLRDSLAKNYKYVVLVDNDVWVDGDAIRTMYCYMEEHSDVGIVGPKILRMDKRDYVQDLGGSINERYNMQGNYADVKDEHLPKEVESEYISTCTAMARVSAVKLFGMMPEENFIYWDDVEWSRKCQACGFKTVAIGDAKVWHYHSIKTTVSPFVKYYLLRNKLKYFSKYLKKQELPGFYNHMLEEIHVAWFMYRYQKMNALAQTVMHAWEDYLCGSFGKADMMRIVDKAEEDKTDIFDVLLFNEKPLVFELEATREKIEILITLLTRVRNSEINKEIFVVVKDADAFEESFSDVSKDNRELRRLFTVMDDKNVLEEANVFCLCNHVRCEKDRILPKIYIDKYFHCIVSDEDCSFLEEYEMSFKAFQAKYGELFWNKILEMRKKQR